MVWPRPWQVGQVRSMAKKPCWARTRPWPAQVRQVVGLEPALAPVPEHASQAMDVGSLIVASPAPSAHDVAEQVVENVGHRGAEAVVHAAAAALLEGGMAVAVVGGALLAVGKMLIGLVELLEPRLGVLVAGIAVRVILHRLLAERGFQLRVAGALGDAENFVKVAFGH